MPRRPTDDDGFGSDSFLDIVANIVGILIILVMVVGVRVKQFPQAAAAAVAPVLGPLLDLTRWQQELGQLERQARRRSASLSAARQKAKPLERQVEATRRRLADQRRRNEALLGRLNDQQRQRAELQASVNQQRQFLTQLERELKSIRPTPDRTVKVVSYPTPLSKVVKGPEAHFQLRGGRVVHVPFQALLSKFKTDARSKAATAPRSSRLEAVVGTVGSFDLRYSMRRVGGAVWALERFSFIPKSGRLGETLEQAAAPDSQFRRALASFDPNTATVTLWTYPDSFAAYRQLKENLYLLGYSVAARPLPHGELISGSPQGTKSSSQ